MPGTLITVYNLVAGGVLLWFGAETFVRSSSALAIRMGLTPLVVGLTIVAFGTSSPELGVSLISTFRGMGDVATGNVVGSNIANVGLILGLSALIRPIRIEPKLLQLDVPIVVAVSLLVTILFNDGRLSRLEGDSWYSCSSATSCCRFASHGSSSTWRCRRSAKRRAGDRSQSFLDSSCSASACW